jgi:hypothetical protein
MQAKQIYYALITYSLSFIKVGLHYLRNRANGMNGTYRRLIGGIALITPPKLSSYSISSKVLRIWLKYSPIDPDSKFLYLLERIAMMNLIKTI